MDFNQIEEVIEIMAHDIGAISRVEPDVVDRAFAELKTHLSTFELDVFAALLTRLSIDEIRTVAIGNGTDVARVYARSDFSIQEQIDMEIFMDTVWFSIQ